MKFNHYEILSVLGAGGMGEVWLAEDTRLKRKVALKLLPAELTADAERVRRFEQEAQAASALNHPNIITVYDIGDSEAGRYIVMELVAGRTLRELIADNNSLETLLSLGQQTAKALHAAHAAGITHRDIKPDNIMMRDDGYVKVLDFGLARLRPATENDSEAATLAQQTTPGALLGTVAYMSPEQARGETVSHPSDVFALGIVFYELATGRHPFKAETLVGYLHAITLQEPLPLTQWKPELPAALNALILRMLSKEARQRPTASEVAQTLQDIERRGANVKPQSSEDATMMLPAAPTATTNTDEGFWVAVLPFKWRGANAELEALAEGLSEDIVTGLSRFSYLRVIARGSTLKYANDSGYVRAIGKELGARYVMEGSLRQAGSMLRIAVQLVDAITGAHLWAETYDRHFRAEDIFALQDELVPCIVSTVADWYGVLPKSMSEVVRHKSPESLSPYEALLRFFGYLMRVTAEDHLQTRISLEQAVKKAPGNADCWAMLANIYINEYQFGYNRKPDPLERALAAALRAVESAPSNPSVYFQLAQVRYFRKEFAAFRDAAERAIALNPMDGAVIGYMGCLIAHSGDWDRGCELTEKAMRLNPHHPGWFWSALMNRAYLVEKDYDRALSFALKFNMPGFFPYHLHLAAIYGQLGENKLAERSLRDLLKLKPDIAETIHDYVGMWHSSELVEHWIEGLRKAGLEELQTTATVRDSTGSGSDLVPLNVHDAEEPGRYRSPYRTEASASIAVLPFANISADEENEYFCDGLAEELLNALAKIDELKVAARTSAFSFKGKNTEAREIGKTLNVNTVLEGSVRKAGNRIRINVQLVNAADGYHLWSERYDREMKDIFDVQDEITLAVVDALKVKLLGAKKAAVLKRYTDNTEAYQLYLKGRFQFGKYTEAGWGKAIEYFEQALALESDYAPAYAGIAEACGFLWYFGLDARPEVIARERAAIAKALEVDVELADAWRSQALLQLLIDWDFSAAEQSLARALAFNPNDALTHAWHGVWLTVMGRREQAVTAARRARELDPFSLVSGVIVGWTLFFAERYEESMGVAQALLEIDPHFSDAYRLLGTCHLALENYAAAEDALQQALAGDAVPVAWANLCGIYAYAGKQAEAQQIVRQIRAMREQHSMPALVLAYCHIFLDEVEEAFVWLEQALAERNAELVYLGAIPERFISFRHDPRFTDLLRRIGLPTEELPQTDESLEANTMLLPPNVSSKPAGDPWAVSSPQRHTVGREQERHELRAAFDAAKDARGALVCVAGEPGIGKTTLVEDFLSELAAANQCRIARGRCSERLAGTEAYLPLLEALESLLAQKAPLGVGQDLILPYSEKMKQLAPTWYAQVVPLNSESEESARLLNEVKAASQERMKRELASFLQAVAEPQPLVIFFDDLHWADVSTIDLLSFLAGKFAAMRVLIVTTYRPSDMLLAKHPFLQIKPDLQARGLCRELQLAFLTEAEIAQYLNLEFPQHRFPTEFPQLIHAKTEGSPLFMADLVRYLRDRGVIAQTSGSWKLEQTLPDIERELPESVRGMIERKIAQLSEEDRKLLTAASVQGYEFDSAVVAQVLQLEPDEVEERLEKLERVFGFVKLVSEGEFPNRALTLKYRFVHLLYQNALYAALRVTRKAKLSAAVANSLEGFYGAQNATVANELSLLWEMAREYAKAAESFRLAAQQASQLFASQEAVQLAQRGLAMAQLLSEGRERNERELALQVVLGNALMATRGYAAPDVSQTYLRARALCEQLGETPHLLPVMLGLYTTHITSGNLAEGLALGNEFLNKVEGKSDPAGLVAHRMIGCPLFCYGELRQARGRFEQILARYQPAEHRSLTWLYGNDVAMTGHSWLAWTLWLLGYPDQALEQSQAAIRLGREVSHAHSLAYALGFACYTHQSRREWQPALELAEAMMSLSAEQGFAMWLGWGTVLRGWALAERGEIPEGINELRRGLDSSQSTGARIFRTYQFCLLAEAYRRAKQTRAALAALEEAQALVEKLGERYWEAEVFRLRGELLLMEGAAVAEVESCFQQASEIARRQEAKSLELRAAISLARLWQQQGKGEEAQAMLAEIYGWFTEGFDTADLQEAKALLDELQATVS
ncbi:MAG: protein kinase [Blastocatellales bacterium]